MRGETHAEVFARGRAIGEDPAWAKASKLLGLHEGDAVRVEFGAKR
jgi:hypothetical protein